MYFPVLDGYRAASIILVLCGHLLPLGPKAWKLNESVAALGMTMFFSLSGFLITSQLLRDQHTGRFLLRRMARIWPLVLAYTTVVFIALQFAPGKFAVTNLFLVNYLRQYLDSWNGHLWSLCVEIQFYVGIALTVAIGGRKALWCVWPACLAITATRIATGTEISIETHVRVDEILAGACVATLSLHSKTLRPLVSVWLLLATLAACHPASGALQYIRPYLTAALLLSVLQQSPERWLALVATSQAAKYIADISYALYVIHPAFTHGWFEGTTPFDKYAIKRPIAIMSTFAAAHISTFYWERPWIDLAKSLSTRKLPVH